MSILFTFIIAIVLFSSYKRKKDIFHPIVLLFSSWFIVLFFYSFTNHGFYPLGYRFYISLTLWCLAFLIGTSIEKSGGVGKVRFNANKRIIKLYWILASASTLLIAYESIKMAMSGDYFFLMLRSMNTGLDEDFHREGSSITGYLANILNVIYLYELLRPAREFNKKKVLFLLALCVLSGVVTMAKTNFFLLLFSSLVALHYKGIVHTRHVLISAGGFLLFAIGMQQLRSIDSSDFESTSFLASYTLSGSAAFQSVKINDFCTDGRHVFRLFYAIAHAFNRSIPVEDTIYDYTIIGPYGSITNVYTYMYTFFIDFGYVGIVMGGMFMGWFSNYFYKRRMYNQASMICYSIFSTFIFLGFFGDFVVTNASNTIQYIFYAYLPYLYRINKITVKI